jgi:hypothetical protein
LKSESSAFSYQQYKKDKLKDALDAELKNRIFVKSDKVKVNERVMSKIRTDANGQFRNRRQQKDQEAKEKLLEDDRFGGMFSKKEFTSNFPSFSKNFQLMKKAKLSGRAIHQPGPKPATPTTPTVQK